MSPAPCFQTGEGKQRSEWSAENRRLKMLLNNIWLLLSEISLTVTREKQTLYTIEETPVVVTSGRDPHSVCRPTRGRSRRGFGGSPSPGRVPRTPVTANPRQVRSGPSGTLNALVTHMVFPPCGESNRHIKAGNISLSERSYKTNNSEMVMLSEIKKSWMKN